MARLHKFIAQWPPPLAAVGDSGGCTWPTATPTAALCPPGTAVPLVKARLQTTNVPPPPAGQAVLRCC